MDGKRRLFYGVLALVLPLVPCLPTQRPSGDFVVPDSAFALSNETDSAVESTDSGASDNPMYSEHLFEGDIVGIEKDQNMTKSLEQNGMKDERFRWKNGEIPYLIDRQYQQKRDSSGRPYIQMIMEAMDVYHRKTCIRFRPMRRGVDRDYIYIVPGSGCSSGVGRIGGRQEVKLRLPDGRNGHCMFLGTVEHELMHAIGFMHEQSRTDRDTYVEINWRNIPSGDKNGDYQKYSKAVITPFGKPYDFSSVMHYDYLAFAIDRDSWAIRPRPDFYKDNMGYLKRSSDQQKLSKTDIAKINAMYNCRPAANSATGEDESEEKTENIDTPCPAGSGWMRFEDNCYYFSYLANEGKRSFNDAQNTCAGYGGEMANPSGRAMSSFVQGQLTENSVWVANCRKTSTKFAPDLVAAVSCRNQLDFMCIKPAKTIVGTSTTTDNPYSIRLP